MKRNVFLIGLTAVCGAFLGHAEPVFVSDAALPMQAHATDRTGAAFAIVDAPAGAEARKVARVGWNEPHESFLEYYQANDLALPTGDAPQGRLILRVWTEQPDALWALGVRVKTPEGEIFHFDTKLTLGASRWENVVVEIKQGASKSNWGGAQSGRLDGPLLFTGLSLFLNADAPAGCLVIDRISWDGSAAAADATVAASAPKGPRLRATDVAREDLVYPLEEAHLFSPLWKSRVIQGESVLLLKAAGEDVATGTLLAAPARVLRVRSSDRKTEYKVGEDYTIDTNRRRLVLTPGSRIPFLEESELYKKKGETRAISAKLGDPATYLLYAERWFPTKQVEVDYEPSGTSSGRVLSFARETLPRMIAKLRKREPVTIVAAGDSITAGANASKGIPPHQPAYPALFHRGLKQAYGGPVALANLGKGGATAQDGVAAIASIASLRPDLVLIAYGMNDTAGGNPTGYQKQIRAIVDGVRAASPDTEFILVSSSLANPEWSWSPAKQFAPYRDALQALTGPGVALADVTALWSDLLKTKRYLDLTGNGINHPNDFGHRLQAQLLLALLIDPALAVE